MTQPRRWFQIHLSTAIVMMIVASILLLNNFRPEVLGQGSQAMYEVKGIPPDYLLLKYGWPVGVILKERSWGSWQTRWEHNWRYRLGITFAFNVIVIVLTAIAFESFIRHLRREIARSHS
jgi:hypothetical protein